MNLDKKYLLIWFYKNHVHYLSEGTKIKLIAERFIKNKSRVYKGGKLIIISEQGLRYRLKK